jgi:hypothetical protein
MSRRRAEARLLLLKCHFRLISPMVNVGPVELEGQERT